MFGWLGFFYEKVLAFDEKSITLHPECAILAGAYRKEYFSPSQDVVACGKAIHNDCASLIPSLYDLAEKQLCTTSQLYVSFIHSPPSQTFLPIVLICPSQTLTFCFLLVLWDTPIIQLNHYSSTPVSLPVMLISFCDFLQFYPQYYCACTLYLKRM